MKVVIEIPDEEYEEIINSEDCGLHTLTRAIANGTPLEEHCNNCEIGNPCLYCKHSFEERGEQDADSN